MLSTLLLSGLIGIGVIIAVLGNNEDNDTIEYSKEDELNYAEETYQYLRYMTTDEIEEYVNYNYVLSRYDYKIYGTCNKDNKDLVIRNICDLAEKEGRSFTNKYSRY